MANHSMIEQIPMIWILVYYSDPPCILHKIPRTVNVLPIYESSYTKKLTLRYLIASVEPPTVTVYLAGEASL